VKTMSFGEAILEHWNRRKTKIEHAYSITAWALCVMKEICEDVTLRFIGAHRDANAVKEVVTRLH